MADGNEFNIFQIKESGGPVEGSSLMVSPKGVFKAAPNPNAARLFQCYCFAAECQQLVSDFGGFALVPSRREGKGGRPLRDIKVMKEPPRSKRTPKRSKRTTRRFSDFRV